MPYSLFMIQFGWRLVTLVILGFSLMAPLSLEKSSRQLKILCLIGIIIPGVLSIHFASDSTFEELDYSYGVGWQNEYMPVNLIDHKEYYDSRSHNVINIDTKEEVRVKEGDYPKISFSIKDNGVYELPRIFYYGYSLVDESKEKITLKESDNGFLEANLKTGDYTLEFKGSLIYRVCSLISLGTLISIIVYLIIRKIKSYRKESL